jgi:hypothetical protein
LPFVAVLLPILAHLFPVARGQLFHHDQQNRRVHKAIPIRKNRMEATSARRALQDGHIAKLSDPSSSTHCVA